MREPRRTIEDMVAEKDGDYKRAQNSAVGWAVRNAGEDVVEDVHDRRFNHVIEAEMEDRDRKSSPIN